MVFFKNVLFFAVLAFCWHCQYVQAVADDLDDFHEDLDDDEFDNIPTETSDSSEELSFLDPKQGKQPAAKAEMYYPEILVIFFLVVYIINLFQGSSRNQEIADEWLNLILENIVKPQFTKAPYWNQNLGMEAKQIKEAQHCFRYYASGRRNCRGFLSTLDLIKRHDLFCYILGYFDFATTEDTVTIEVPMLKMDHFVFVLFPSKDENIWRRELTDMTTYAKRISFDVAGLACYTDAPELATSLVPSDMKRALEEFRDVIKLVHFTDNHRSETYPLVLRFKFRLPKDMTRMKKAVSMCLHLIDRVAETRLSASAKAKCEQKRKKMLERRNKVQHRTRQEEIQRRRDEDPNKKIRKRRTGPKIKFGK